MQPNRALLRMWFELGVPFVLVFVCSSARSKEKELLFGFGIILGSLVKGTKNLRSPDYQGMNSFSSVSCNGSH